MQNKDRGKTYMGGGQIFYSQYQGGIFSPKQEEKFEKYLSHENFSKCRHKFNSNSHFFFTCTYRGIIIA